MNTPKNIQKSNFQEQRIHSLEQQIEQHKKMIDELNGIIQRLVREIRTLYKGEY